jgi:SAM-dependent methyltransferase
MAAERHSKEPSLEQMNDYDFYHIIELSPGVSTPGIPSLLPVQKAVHDELNQLALRGKRVLDIGCRDGLFCFEAERLGASQIVGIDNDISLAAVEFLIPWFKSNVSMERVNLYEFSVSPDKRFDIVIFAGVLYHLRFPFLGLKKIADAMQPGGTMIVETGLLLSNAKHPMIYCPKPKDSPFDPTSVTFFNHLALVAGLESLGFEDVICKNVQVWDAEPRGYAGWDALLNGPDCEITLSTDIVVGRGTYTCRLREGLERTAEGDLRSYWYGEHQLNSNKSLADRFLDAYRPGNE